MEGSGGPAGEPERTIESVWDRLVRSRARVGGSRDPREHVRGPAGVPGGSQWVLKLRKTEIGRLKAKRFTLKNLLTSYPERRIGG